jgi:outer membrane lipoprotein LolB
LKLPQSVVSPPEFRALFPVLLLVVGGCATQRSSELPAMPDWSTRSAVLHEITRWEFHGRIGVKNGDEGFNGNLWWWQRDNDFRASIGGPLGAGTVRISGYGSQFTITDKDGAEVEIRDAEAELQAMYGWTIPVDSLRYWALGIPHPHEPADMEFGDEGLLATLLQQGWRVVFDQYRQAGGQPMPRRLTAQNDQGKVVLVIDDWSFY